jgi:hypothetical protein
MNRMLTETNDSNVTIVVTEGPAPLTEISAIG